MSSISKNHLQAYDWEEVHDALDDFRAYLEAAEPHAANTIAALEQARASLPDEDFFED